MKNLNVQVETVINAPVDEIFLLICPVMEYRWIPGWKCELIRFTGNMGQDTEFREFLSAPMLMNAVVRKTTWSVVAFEPDHHRVQFRLDNKQSSSLLTFSFKQTGENQTACVTEITTKPLNASGERVVNNHGDKRLKLLLMALQALLKYYCENGQTMMPVSDALKLTGLVSGIPTMTRIKSTISKLALLFYRDKNRIRFLNGQRIHVNGKA